jgi:hypothetical protein
MKQKLILALVLSGVFGQITSAGKFVDELGEGQKIDLYNALKNEALEKSIKVALATIGREKKSDILSSDIEPQKV